MGFLNVTFSLLADGLTSASVLVEREADLVTNVTDALLFFLCQDTDFAFLNGANEQTCPATRRGLRKLEDNEYAGESILRPDQKQGVLQDRSQGGFNYTVWMLEYPVMQIGDNYMDTSEDNALQTMQSVAQVALNVRINNGDFDERLGNGVQTAVVGTEVAAWTEELEGYYDPLDPAPLHALRVAGIILFLFSTAVTCFISHLAKQRRIEREWDAEYKERGKGGLVTEEGLDYMLEASRKQSRTQNENAESTNRADKKKDTTEGIETILSDDEDSKLPLPGYMNVELRGAPSSQIMEGKDSSSDSYGGFDAFNFNTSRK